jgi:hypothetical protein
MERSSRASTRVSRSQIHKEKGRFAFTNGVGPDSWRVWARVMQTIGAIGCLAVFVWSFALIGHYTSTRPYGPVPEHGWTARLPWCYGCYGTFEEKQQLLQLDDWFIPFFFVAFVGTWVQQLREKKEPWRQKTFGHNG